MKNSIELSRISIIRERKGVSGLAAAACLDVTPQGYRGKERNGSFSLKDLPLLANLFDMTMEELVRELNPAYMSEAEARAAHYRGQPLEEMANPFQFMEALYERRAEVAALLSDQPPAPAPATKPNAKGG